MSLERALRRSLERYWAGELSAGDVGQVAADLRRRRWIAMRDAGLDEVPVNDFSLYDHVLDMAVTVGAVPARHAAIADPLARYFAMARSLQHRDASLDLPDLDMTTWFDITDHAIVPELALDQTFALDASKLLGEIAEAQALGLAPRPVVTGPVTFLRLSRVVDDDAGASAVEPLVLLNALLPVYESLLARLAHAGVERVQIDEPSLALDLRPVEQAAYRHAFARLAAVPVRPRLLIAASSDRLDEQLPLATWSGCEGLQLDLVRHADHAGARHPGFDKTTQRRHS